MVIFGGNRLCGEVKVSGAKNAALPILFATILITKDRVFLQNIPRIRDVELSFSILRELGITVEKKQSVYEICTDLASYRQPSASTVGEMRASTYLMGAMLGRFGRVEMPMPGGCDFGTRPIDLHLLAFEKMGAKCEKKEDRVIVSAERLHGATVVFPIVSVGATVNALLAAVAAEGESVIVNAARETHVSDLCRFLCACGAEISGIGTPILRICGGKALHGCSYRIIDDTLEMATYLSAAFATRGEVKVKGQFDPSIEPIVRPLYEMGALIREEDDGVSLNAEVNRFGTAIRTAPSPGFPTDLHPLFTVLLCLTKNGGSVEETVWQERFRYALELQKMGASLRRVGSRIYATPSSLRGESVVAVDLRAGAALIIAGLASRGKTVIKNTELIERGYESIADKLCALGANIEKRQ